MQKIKQFGIILIMLLVVVLPVYASSRPNVVVSGFGVKEGEANVGKDATLVVNLTNIGTLTCANAVTTNIEAHSPFILQGISTISVGDICEGTRSIEFPLKIEPNAIGGTYPISITNSYESITFVQFTTTNVINLYISGSPNINAYVTSSQPLDIYPGDTATIAINLENNGDYQAEVVNAVMTAPQPIEVKWSKSVNAVALLGPKQTTTMEYSIEIPKDAKATTYPLTLEVSYQDENLNAQSKTFTFTMQVKDKADFETKDVGSTPLYANQNKRNVRFSVKNVGTDSAYKVRTRIQPQFPFSMDGSLRYIDAVKVGESQPLEFTVDVDKDATPGRYVLDVLLDFEDLQGRKFEDTTQIGLTVNETTWPRAVFINYWYAWAVLVIIVVIVLSRKMRKKKVRD
jgi:hypothetical protein